MLLKSRYSYYVSMDFFTYTESNWRTRISFVTFSRYSYFFGELSYFFLNVFFTRISFDAICIFDLQLVFLLSLKMRIVLLVILNTTTGS